MKDLLYVLSFCAIFIAAITFHYVVVNKLKNNCEPLKYENAVLQDSIQILNDSLENIKRYAPEIGKEYE